MNAEESATSATMQSDSDLVAACIQGDRDSWEEFVRRYCRLIHFLVRRTVARRSDDPDPHLLDDMVSEVFCALLEDDCRLLRQYSARYRFSTWLGVIAHSRAINALRKKSPPSASLDAMGDEEQQRLESLLVDAGQAPDQIAEDREQVQALGKAMQELRPRDRLVLAMFYEDSASLSEIASVIGVSYNSVRPLILRAQDRLKKAVNRE
ncbi:MAG: sigma-70 family RNA polymerase sigma factor [Planctomycetota bacterium]